MGEMINTYKILFGKPERKRLLGMSRRRLEDNIRMYLRDMLWGRCGLDDWMHLAQDRKQWRALVNMPMNIWVP
jgi:hypothetical protein